MNCPSLHRGALAVVALFLMSCLPSSAPAQISTDRPGFGDGSATVSSQTVQVELGYSFTGNGANNHELGQLLLRYGVTPAVELRGGIGSVVLTDNQRPAPVLATTPEPVVELGYTGTSAGVKGRLFHNNATTVSGLATLRLPTEAGHLGSADDRARQELKLAIDRAVGNRLALSVNAGTRFFYAAGIQNDRAVEWLLFPSLSASLTESVEAYVGYAGFYSDGLNANWGEGGLTLLQSADTQFDVNTGLRLDDRSDAFFLGLGIAHRF